MIIILRIKYKLMYFNLSISPPIFSNVVKAVPEKNDN